MADNPATTIVRVDAPVREILVLVIASVTALVYGSQRIRPSGPVAWFNAPIMLFSAVLFLILGSALANYNTNDPVRFVQIMSGAVLVSILYPVATSGVSIARTPNDKDGGVYRSVYTVILVVGAIVMLSSLVSIIGVAVGGMTPRTVANVLSLSVPVMVSVLMFDSAILVSN